MDLLVDAGNRGEMGGRELGQLVGDPGGIAAPEADAGAGADHDRLGDAGHHVRQRQELVQDMAVVDPQLVDVHPGRREHVGVGQHAPLGRSGRPGGVDQRGQALRTGRRQTLGHRLGSDRPRSLEELRQSDRPRGLAGKQDHMFQLGTALAYQGDLGRLLDIAAEHRPGAGVAQHVGTLGRGIGVVDGRDDPPGAQDAVIGERPFRAGGGEDRHPVAGADAQRDQAPRDLGHARAQLRVGDRDLPAVTPVAQRRAGVTAGGVERHRAERPGRAGRGLSRPWRGDDGGAAHD